MGAGWDIGIGDLPPGLIGMKADGGKETCGKPNGDGVINEWFICGQFGVWSGPDLYIVCSVIWEVH